VSSVIPKATFALARAQKTSATQAQHITIQALFTTPPFLLGSYRFSYLGA
jgi:hypothetical protein